MYTPTYMLFESKRSECSFQSLNIYAIFLDLNSVLYPSGNNRNKVAQVNLYSNPLMVLNKDTCQSNNRVKHKVAI